MKSANDRGTSRDSFLLQHFNHRKSILTIKSTCWFIKENKVGISDQLHCKSRSFSFLS